MSARSRKSISCCAASRSRERILFYSTDYDELIGCCNRVAVFYDGTITRVLQGPDLTEHNLIGAALNLTSAASPPHPSSRGSRTSANESRS